MSAVTMDDSNFPARDRLNDRMVRETRVTGATSYTTGGDALPDIGMGDIYGVYGVLSNGTNIRVAVWNYTTQKLQFWDPAAGTEVANAASLAAYSGTLLITGKG